MTGTGELWQGDAPFVVAVTSSSLGKRVYTEDAVFDRPLAFTTEGRNNVAFAVDPAGGVHTLAVYLGSNASGTPLCTTTVS